MVAIPASQALFALVAWLYFRRGNWKKIEV
jgi:Na+-driven multidrug efflux pump